MHIPRGLDGTPCFLCGNVLNEHFAPRVQLTEHKTVRKAIFHPRFFGGYAGLALLVGDSTADMFPIDIVYRYRHDAFHRYTFFLIFLRI